MDGLFEVKGIDKCFGDNHVVNNVSFSVKAGEVFSLLGPSGCGKTTVLRMIGGFEEPSKGGCIFLDGKDLSDVPANKRQINTVFQNYALFPHMSLFDNIAFGPKMAGEKSDNIEKRVYDMLKIIRLEDHAHKFPNQISGGQKQRIAIARALINRPKVLLLDEPLAALDLKLRQHMLLELDRIHDEVGTTFIYVTHDQNEAMSLSDRVAVMNNGVIEQIGTPVEIYENPHTKFVASFIGDTNFFEGTIVSKIDAEYAMVEFDGLGKFPCFNDYKLPEGKRVSVSIRPEKFRILDSLPSGDLGAGINVLEAEIIDIIYQGSHTRYWVRSKDKRINVLRQHNRCYLDLKQITWGDKVWIAWHKDDISTLPL